MGPDSTRSERIRRSSSRGRGTGAAGSRARIDAGATDDTRMNGEADLLFPASTGLVGVRPLTGALPVDIEMRADGERRLRPVVMFAPAHLRAEPTRLADAFALEAQAPESADRAIALSRSAMTVGDSGNGAPGASGGTLSESGSAVTAGTGGGPGGGVGNPHGDGSNGGIVVEPSPLDAQFVDLASYLLEDSSSGTAATVRARASDATYDFEQYILLRERDDPVVQVGFPPRPIPADPRYHRFLAQARAGVAQAVEFGLLPFGAAALQMGGPAGVLADQLFGWWSSVCGVRAFNRLQRYDAADIARAAWAQTDKSREAYYCSSLGFWLMSTIAPEMTAYLGGTSNALDEVWTLAYWEDVLAAVFDNYFGQVDVVDPSAPIGAYPFDPFPTDEIVFGLRVIHRQSWRQLAFARGDLVGTVPLGPREIKKVSVKTTRRSRVARTTEETQAFETSGEAAATSRETSEVVDEATSKLTQHAEGEVGGGYPPFFSAKVSAGTSDDAGRTSRETKGNLNELMQKTASRMKRDTKVSITTEGETTFEQVGSAELTNPNEEVAITYLDHRPARGGPPSWPIGRPGLTTSSSVDVGRQAVPDGS